MSDLNVSLGIKLRDGVSAPAAKAGASVGKLAARIEGAGKRVDRLAELKSGVDTYRDLESSLGRSATAMDKARRRAERLGRSMEGATRPTADLRAKFALAAAEAAEATFEFGRQKNSLAELRQQLRGAGVDTSRLKQLQGRLGDQLERSRARLARTAAWSGKASVAQDRLASRLETGSRMALVGESARRIGSEITQALARPVERARLVERSRGELASLKLGDEGVETVVQQGRKTLRELPEMPLEDFVSAAYDIKSGIESLDARGVAEMTDLAALTARATKGSVAEMTNLFASAHGMFKDSLYAEVDDAKFGAVLSAQIAQVVESARTDGVQMRQAIVSMGAGLAQSGISLEQQVAALGMLQSKGKSGSEAGTILLNLEKSAAKAHQRFQEMGLDVDILGADDNMLGLSRLLQGMQEEFGAEYTSAIGARITEAFGTDEAASFFKSLWGQQDRLAALESELRQAGEAGRAFTKAMQARRDSNADARLQLAEQRWADVQIRIGDALLPTIEKLLPHLEDLAEGLADAIEKWPGLSAFVIGGAGAFAMLARFMGPAITGFVSLGIAASWLKKQFYSLGASASARRLDLDDSSGGLGGKGKSGRGGRSRPKRKAPGLGGRVRSIAADGLGRLKRKAPGLGGRVRSIAADGLGRLKRKAPGLGGRVRSIAADGLGRLKRGAPGLGKWLRHLGTPGRVLGGLATAGALAQVSAATGPHQRTATLARQGSGLAGSLAGAALGSMILPGVGTLAGGFLGGLAGDWLGDLIARRVGVEKASGDSPGQAETDEATRPSADQSPLGPAEPSLLSEAATLAAAAKTRDASLASIETRMGEAVAALQGVRPGSVDATFHIEQRPGESAESLAERVLEMLRDAQGLERREAAYDAF